MGVLSVGATVLTSFKADTKQHRAGLKKLQGAEKKRGDALLSSMDKQNNKMDKQIGRLAKLAVGVAAVAATFKTMSASFSVYAEREKFLASGAGKNMERLREASHGLLTDMRILQIESQLLNGAFKITNSELVRAFKGMVALSKAGNDFEEVQKRVGMSLVKGNVRQLEEFGVALKGTKGTVETFQKILTALDDKVKDFAGNLETRGDATKRAMVDLKNATDNLKLAWGGFANTVLPSILSGLTALLNKAQETYKWWQDKFGKAKGKVDTHTTAGDWIQKKILKDTKIPMKMRHTYDGRPSPGQYLAQQVAAGRTRLVQIMDEYVEKYGRGGSIGLSGDVMDQPEDRVRKLVYDNIAKLEGDLLKFRKATRQTGKKHGDIQAKKAGVSPSTLAATGGVPEIIVGGKDIRYRVWTLADGTKMIENVKPIEIKGFKPDKDKKPDWKKIKAARDKEISNLIKSAVDPKKAQEELDELLAEKDVYGIKGGVAYESYMENWSMLSAGTLAVNTLTSAWVGMQEAAGAALGAVMTGTGDFGAIFKKMTADILVAIAIEESVMAMKEAALAVGWFFTPGGQAIAAGHAEASALHLAAAGAAAVGARVLGSGSSTGGATPNTARGAATGRGSQTIILGADFETDSSRRRTHRLASMMQTANMTGAGDTVIEWA